jgi:hypothetical protein
VTATPPSLEPPSPPESGTGPLEDIGPETVPDSPAVPDDPGSTGSIFGSPTDVFAG